MISFQDMAAEAVECLRQDDPGGYHSYVEEMYRRGCSGEEVTRRLAAAGIAEVLRAPAGPEPITLPA
mgnify:CR=1 FL=1